MDGSAFKRVVIGGGVAGVCCAQELARLHPTSRVILICEGPTVVETSSLFRITEHLEELSVYERSTDSFTFDNPNVHVQHCKVTGVCYDSQEILVQDKEGARRIVFDQLCIATGVRPKLIASHPNVIGLRDLQSVEDLVGRLRSARRVVVVGNGGIALELIHELTFCDVDWVVKNNYIGSAFFDASASAFIMPTLLSRATCAQADPPRNTDSVDCHQTNTTNRLLGGTVFGASSEQTSAAPGCGLGPEWLAKTSFKSCLPSETMQRSGSLKIHYEQEITAFRDATAANIGNNDTDINTTAYPLYVCTTSGQELGCDFLISATGVTPNTSMFIQSSCNAPSAAAFEDANSRVQLSPTKESQLECTEEGYIQVDSTLHTNIKNVFAAGDCCAYPVVSIHNSNYVSGSLGPVSHFFQMRLWTQARWMGIFAAHSMSGCIDDYAIDTKFELFSHVTRFFGHKVIMLGRYNAQGLGESVENLTKEFVVTEGRLQPVIHKDTTSGTSNSSNTPAHPVEVWVRITPSVEYVKLVVYKGKLVGALLIGDTDLEEVCENLILNGLDISGVGVDILNPEIDIADYFD